MNKENKLGMGLGALLSTSNDKNEINNGVQKINISQIIPNPSQPRKNFKDEELKELSSSISSTIKLNYKVDKELIGGLKLQLGSFMIDTSIKNKLNKYKKAMLES